MDYTNPNDHIALTVSSALPLDGSVRVILVGDSTCQTKDDLAKELHKIEPSTLSVVIVPVQLPIVSPCYSCSSLIGRRYHDNSSLVLPSPDLTLLDGGATVLLGPRVIATTTPNNTNTPTPHTPSLNNTTPVNTSPISADAANTHTNVASGHNKCGKGDYTMKRLGGGASDLVIKDPCQELRLAPLFTEVIDPAEYDELIAFIMRYIATVPCPKTARFFVRTENGLFVSPLGYDCTPEQRMAFMQLDAAHAVRSRLCKLINERFGHMRLACHLPSPRALYYDDDGISVCIRPKHWAHTLFLPRALEMCKIPNPRLISISSPVLWHQGHAHIHSTAVPVKHVQVVS
jgi:Eukaryotic phosphomannomutase